MQIHLISGFLGSGKTTAIKTACTNLQERNLSVAVITNDQGIKLVDTKYFESNSIPNRQVIDGCFCCNYHSLNENIQSLTESNKPDIIFAESVGSCTDIIATVMKPLLKFHAAVNVTVSTFADARLLQMLYVYKKQLFNNEVQYIYQKQLEEAPVIVVSKIDLVTADELDKVKRFLQSKYPYKKIICINGTEAKGIHTWLTATDNLSNISLSSLNIDYNIYGSGEAMLAWLDAELKIYSASNKAIQEAMDLIETIRSNIQQENLTIGHLKFFINDAIKISYTATEEKQSNIKIKSASTAALLINARIQTSPEILTGLINNAIQQIETSCNCNIMQENFSSFKPGFPTPAYRLLN